MVLGGSVEALPAAAQAMQDGVTVYGIVDMAIRSTTNANAAGNGKMELIGGTFNGSRIGFRGVENLGGGKSAYFVLENGFSPDTGSTAGFGNRLFGRFAHLGLKSDYGSIQVGRDSTIGYDTVGLYDPISPFNNNFDLQMHAVLVGDRVDNSVKYRYQGGPFQFGLQYAFGEQPGSLSKGQTAGTSLAYSGGPWTLAGVFEQFSDGLDNKAKVSSIGAAYQFEKAKLTAGYIHRRTDAFFDWSPSAANTGIAGAIENLTNAGNPGSRTDRMWMIGANYKASAAWTLYGAYHRDRASNIAGGDGTRHTLYGIASYSFSKRTDVYVETDYNKADGALVAQPLFGNGIGANQSKRLGLSLGLRHKF
jgi:predicted porin